MSCCLSSGLKDTKFDCFHHNVMLYGINYIFSNILTAQMCFTETHFKNIRYVLFECSVVNDKSILHVEVNVI